MHLVLLHSVSGAAGIWDEILCLVVPATAIMGVALAVLRQQPGQPGDDEPATGGDDAPAPDQAPAGAGEVGRQG